MLPVWIRVTSGNRIRICISVKSRIRIRVKFRSRELWRFVKEPCKITKEPWCKCCRFATVLWVSESALKSHPYPHLQSECLLMPVFNFDWPNRFLKSYCLLFRDLTFHMMTWGTPVDEGAERTGWTSQHRKKIDRKKWQESTSQNQSTLDLLTCYLSRWVHSSM